MSAPEVTEAGSAREPLDSSHDHEHHSGHDHAHGGDHLELIFALIACVCTAVGWSIEFAGVEALAHLPLWCFIAAYFFGGVFTVREVFESLSARRFEIDALMCVAAVGAASLGEWFEGALLLSLFSLGHALEHRAMNKAREAIASLAMLAPEEATVRRGTETVRVSITELVPGDEVLIRPDERIPADGFVIQGQSAVNQASITGESMPVDKRPIASMPERFEQAAAAHRLYAGTLNGSGAMTMRVARAASQSTLARVVELVESAEAMQSPTQRLTQKFERVFVPSVLVLVGVLMCAGFVIDEPFSQSFYRAMAVLVASSPCALAIATPSAVLSAVAAGGKSGVLIKGGAPLEHLGKIDAVAFDKTGTLTRGEPRVVDVWLPEGQDERQLWSVAAAVERLSEHPLARAVVHHVDHEQEGVPVLEAHGMQSVTGKGVRALIDQEEVLMGNAALFESSALAADVLETLEQMTQRGLTIMIVQRAGVTLGVIGLMDTPREGITQALEELRVLGIKRMIMISGDHERVAQTIAAQIGLDEAYGDLMPEDKVKLVEQLSHQGAGVLMVGDGVNDAPAMAHATVAIAMGAAGSDTALETAQIALMSDDITRLPYAVKLGRKTSRIIAQNLWLSLGMVAVLIPATLLGLSIGPAVALHEGSTLIVVFNALRLLRFRA